MAQIIDPGNPLYPLAQAFDIAKGINPTEEFLGPLKGVGQAVEEVYHSLILALGFAIDPQHWLRVAEAVAGAVLILVGLLLLAKETPAGQAVQRNAGTAAKVAALA